MTNKELQDKCSEISGTPFDYFKAGYEFAQDKWHKFPDELPEDFQNVLTVALSDDIDEGSEKFYHVFTFGEKQLLKKYLEHNREPSHLFLQWNSSNNYEVVAWCELPEYKGKE